MKLHFSSHNKVVIAGRKLKHYRNKFHFSEVVMDQESRHFRIKRPTSKGTKKKKRQIMKRHNFHKI